MTTDDARRRTLGELVRKRREFLRLSIDEAASRAPMGPTTWVRVEQGKRVRGLTLPGIDHVLGWADDASRDYMETGKEPELADPSTTRATAETAVGTGRVEDATVTVIEGRASTRQGSTSAVQEVGLPSAPPFPKPKTKSQAAVNRYWEALKAIAEGEGDEAPPADRTVRTLKRAALDLEEFRESAEG